jgi:RNA polymerase sigma-70 factor (ECF subfamily)
MTDSPTALEGGPFDHRDDEIMRLLTAHQGMVYAYILALHPNRSAAQDILQETNMAMWRKRDQFEPGTNFKAWAFRFAKFQTLDHLKRVKNRRWLVFGESLLEMMSEEACEMPDDFEERRGALKKCLSKLSESEQELIRAHYQSGLPLAELGDRLGRSQAAVKQLLFRLRRSLKTCIERQLSTELRPT